MVVSPPVAGRRRRRPLAVSTRALLPTATLPLAALAQEALELAGQDGAGGQPARVRAGVLPVGVALQPLDERLHVGVELDGARDLPLVVAGRVLELGRVDG